VERWFREQLAPLWPVALVLSAYGGAPAYDPLPRLPDREQHVSYVLYGRHQGRRFAAMFPIAWRQKFARP